MKSHLRSHRLVTLAAALATLLGAAAQARDIRSSDVFPSGYPTVQGVVEMDRLMRLRSHGRLRITTIGQNDQDTESYTVAQLISGAQEMARVNLSVLSRIAPPTAAPSLPYLFENEEEARRVLDGPIGDEILASLQAEGLVGLCFYDGGPRDFVSDMRAIRRPQDLKGLRIRVQQSDLWSELLRNLGATPVTIPSSRVRLSLETKVVDGTESSWPAYVSTRQYNVARYFSRTRHSMAPGVILFSKRIWDTLTTEEQSIIRRAARDSVPVMRRLWDEEQTASRAAVEAGGATIVANVDREAFAQAFVSLYPRVIANEQLRKLVRRIRDND
ncbi:TRAP transporter substrate-binding protein DctP [Reyranella sp.]|uniref:TRAP transporter substrate-binding protein DctP n=1 Tax=Reyranella sp. TaxID=1929291 RepID=UPI003BA94674